MNLPLLLIAYLSLFFMALLDNARGPILPLFISEFRLTDIQTAIYYIVAGASALSVNLFFKWWSPYLRPLQGLRFFLFLLIVGGIGQSLASSFSDLLFAVLFFGIAVGGISYYQNYLVSKAATVELLSRAYAGLHAMYGVASLIAPLVVTYLLMPVGGWRLCFQVLGFCPLVLIIYSYKLKELKPEPISHVEHIMDIPKKNQRPWRKGWILGLAISAEGLVTSRLVLMLRTEFLFNEKLASQYLSLYFLCMLLSRLWMSLRKTAPHPQTTMIRSLTINMILFLLGSFMHPIFWVLSGASIAMFFPTHMAWLSQAPVNAQVKSHSELNFVLGVSGVLALITQGIFGGLSQLEGIGHAMYLAPLLSFLALLLLLKPPFSRQKSKLVDIKELFQS